MDDTFIVTVFCIIDEVLVAAAHSEHPLAQASDAEVLTVAVIAAARFANHHERALGVLSRLGYLSGPLSVSRFNRRLHRLGDWLLGILELVGELFLTGEALFAIDSLPVPACHRARHPLPQGPGPALLRLHRGQTPDLLRLAHPSGRHPGRHPDQRGAVAGQRP